MCSLLQIGQRPGEVKRFRFLKTWPHPMHSAGLISSFFPWDFIERAIWERCPQTSFSPIPTAEEISLALISLSLNSIIICFRRVFISLISRFLEYVGSNRITKQTVLGDRNMSEPVWFFRKRYKPYGGFSDPTPGPFIYDTY